MAPGGLQDGHHTACGTLRAGITHGAQLLVDHIRTDVSMGVFDPLGYLVNKGIGRLGANDRLLFELNALCSRDY